jgi:hypothetical protein
VRPRWTLRVSNVAPTRSTKSEDAADGLARIGRHGGLRSGRRDEGHGVCRPGRLGELPAEHGEPRFECVTAAAIWQAQTIVRSSGGRLGGVGVARSPRAATRGPCKESGTVTASDRSGAASSLNEGGSTPTMVISVPLITRVRPSTSGSAPNRARHIQSLMTPTPAPRLASSGVNHRPRSGAMPITSTSAGAADRTPTRSFRPTREVVAAIQPMADRDARSPIVDSIRTASSAVKDSALRLRPWTGRTGGPGREDPAAAAAWRGRASRWRCSRRRRARARSPRRRC